VAWAWNAAYWGTAIGGGEGGGKKRKKKKKTMFSPLSLRHRRKAGAFPVGGGAVRNIRGVGRLTLFREERKKVVSK